MVKTAEPIIYTPESIKKCFSKYGELMRENEIILQRIDDAKMREYAIKSSKLDGMPHSPSSEADKIGNNVAKVVLLEQSAAKVAKEAEKLYYDIDETINLINGKGYAEKRAVLQLKYLDCLRWSEINNSLFGDKDDFLEREDSYLRRAHKLCKAALQDLCDILNVSAGNSADIPLENLRKIQT